MSGNYNSYAISFLKEWGNLRAKLEAISDEKARVENIKIYDLVDNDLKEIGGLNGTSLESLGKPTDFIHLLFSCYNIPLFLLLIRVGVSSSFLGCDFVAVLF